MQNNNDQMGKTKEVPSVPADKSRMTGEPCDNILKDQKSLFDAEDAFSEAVVVEKESVEIGKDAAEVLSVKDLQDTAKDYFDATHSGSIEDKVNELCELAKSGFDEDFDDEAPAEETVDVQQRNVVKEVFGDGNTKHRKKDKKRKRRGIISDDDMEMLSEGIPVYAAKEPEQALPVVENNAPVMAENETGQPESEGSGVEYKNPLGTCGDEEEETEEDKLFKLLAGSKKVSTLYEEDEDEAEYTDRNQEETILGELRSGAIRSAISMILTLVVTLLCVYFEAASGTKLPHPSFFEAGKFGVTYLMCMLQLMFLCVIFNLGGMKRAFSGFRPSKSSGEVYAAATVAVCTLHSVASAVLAYDSPSLRSFCSVGCISLLMLSVNSFMKAYTSLSSFCIAASKSPKLSSSYLGRDSGEAKAFEKYLDEDTTVFTVAKSDFVEGFFKKLRCVPRVGRGSLKNVIAVVLVAAAVGVFGAISKDLYSGITAFAAVCLAAFPANALLSTILPFFAASSRAKKTQTAFIGEAACDMYDSVGVVSFDDTEVFPAKSVKVSSIRTYSENRIDKVILYMARIFDKVEGPLSFVFANSVQNLDDGGIEAQIVEHFSDGISARIDSKEILVGTEDFMRLYDIETPLDNIDESFTRSLGSLMYMSVDGVLAAKFYIKYTMSRSFETILRSFYDAGICVGVKTLDPCITTELVCGNLKGSNYPVSVIKKHAMNKCVCEKTSGAVITLSGVHNFLKGFIGLDNLRNVYRSNKIISTFCMIAGMLLSAALCVTGIVEISVTMLILFQLFWCIPTVLISAFSK